jgi:hypothetical protein
MVNPAERAVNGSNPIRSWRLWSFVQHAGSLFPSGRGKLSELVELTRVICL